MEINDFKRLCLELKEAFPRAYDGSYLNKVWLIWKHLDAKDLEMLVFELKAQRQPKCLAIMGTRLIQLRRLQDKVSEPRREYIPKVEKIAVKPNQEEKIVNRSIDEKITDTKQCLDIKHNDWSTQGLATLLNNNQAGNAWELVSQRLKQKKTQM